MSDEDLREYGLHLETRPAAGAGGDDDREHIGAFVMACDKDGATAALFGDASTPGVLDRDQVTLLVEVRLGQRPLRALGELGPGRKHAITPAQIVATQALLSDHAGLLFIGLYRLCLEHPL